MTAQTMLELADRIEKSSDVTLDYYRLLSAEEHRAIVAALRSAAVPQGVREALLDAISQLIPFAEDGDQPAITACIEKCRTAVGALASKPESGEKK